MVIYGLVWKYAVLSCKTDQHECSSRFLRMKGFYVTVGNRIQHEYPRAKSNACMLVIPRQKLPFVRSHSGNHSKNLSVSVSAMNCTWFPKWVLSALLPPLGCKRMAVSESNYYVLLALSCSMAYHTGVLLLHHTVSHYTWATKLMRNMVHVLCSLLPSFRHIELEHLAFQRNRGQRWGMGSVVGWVWGNPKQPLKLQQPRNYDFGIFQLNLLGSQGGNSREMTTSPPNHHWGNSLALTTAAKLQQFRAVAQIPAPPLNLNLTPSLLSSVLALFCRQFRTTVWKPQFTDPWALWFYTAIWVFLCGNFVFRGACHQIWVSALAPYKTLPSVVLRTGQRWLGMSIPIWSEEQRIDEQAATTQGNIVSKIFESPEPGRCFRAFPSFAFRGQTMRDWICVKGLDLQCGPSKTSVITQTGGKNRVPQICRPSETSKRHLKRQQPWNDAKKTRWVCIGTQIIGWEELTELCPQNSMRAKNLTRLGVWNRALWNLSLMCPRPFLATVPLKFSEF